MKSRHQSESSVSFSIQIIQKSKFWTHLEQEWCFIVQHKPSVTDVIVHKKGLAEVKGRQEEERYQDQDDAGGACWGYHVAGPKVITDNGYVQKEV